MTGKNIRVIGVNAAGITSKLHSFDKLIFDRKPSIWMMQETKRKPTDVQIKTQNLTNYQLFEMKREKNKGRRRKRVKWRRTRYWSFT